MLNSVSALWNVKLCSCFFVLIFKALSASVCHIQTGWLSGSVTECSHCYISHTGPKNKRCVCAMRWQAGDNIFGWTSPAIKGAQELKLMKITRQKPLGQRKFWGASSLGVACGHPAIQTQRCFNDLPVRARLPTDHTDRRLVGLAVQFEFFTMLLTFAVKLDGLRRRRTRAQTLQVVQLGHQVLHEVVFSEAPLVEHLREQGATVLMQC